MNRGPVTSGLRDSRTFVEKLRDAHDEPADWLIALATCADQERLAGAGKRIGYSGSAVSTIIAGKYAGDLDRVEEMVRGALMASTVECPILGEIGRDRCLTEQNEPFRATSSFRAQLFHACQLCPNRRQK